MQAIVKHDVMYCEVFADFEGKEPDDVILPSGSVVELLNNHDPACILVETDTGLCYGDIPLELVTIIKAGAENE